MSSKLLFFGLMLFISSCGVKTRPVSPDKDKTPSIIDEYTKKTKSKKAAK